MKRNELGLVGSPESRSGEIASQQDASAAEGDSGGQRYCTHDDAQKNNVDQQIGNVVLLVEISVLVPGNAGVPVHRAQKRLGVALGKRSGDDRDDRSRALIEERADIFHGCNPRFGLGRMMGGINTAQVFGSQRWRRILDQHQRRSPTRSGVLTQHHFRAHAEINQACGKRRADRAQSQRSLGVFLGIRRVAVVRHEGENRRQVARISSRAWKGASEFAQSRRRHHRQLAEHRVDEDVATVKQDSPVQRCTLVADFFSRHLGLQIEGVSAKSAAGVGKPCSANLERASVVTLVGCGLEIAEPVFLQEGGVGGVCSTGIFAGLRRALNLPPGKLLWENRRCGQSGARAGSIGHARQRNNDGKHHYRPGITHGRTAAHRIPCLIRPQRRRKSFRSRGSSWRRIVQNSSLRSVGGPREYWPAALSILLATFTPLSPFTYLAMPRYRDSAMRWRYSLVARRCSSVGLLTNEISARIEGMLAPISTMNGAFFTPRSRMAGLLTARPLCNDCCTSPANSRDSSILSLSAIFFTRSCSS